MYLALCVNVRALYHRCRKIFLSVPEILPKKISFWSQKISPTAAALDRSGTWPHPGSVHFSNFLCRTCSLPVQLYFVPSPTSSSVSLPLLLLGSRIVILSSSVLFSSFPSSQSLSFSSDSFLLLLPFLFLSIFFSSSLSFFPPSFFFFLFSLLFPFLYIFSFRREKLPVLSGPRGRLSAMMLWPRY